MISRDKIRLQAVALPLCIILGGCAAVSKELPPATQAVKADPQPINFPCQGNTVLPSHIAAHFELVQGKEAQKYEEQAIQPVDQGGLCNGQVYRKIDDAPVNINRAWDSTNPGGQFSNWWTFGEINGKTGAYRENYAICASYSILDMMNSCDLKKGAVIVLGPGQSAKCSKYLTYSQSAYQQVYFPNAEKHVENCQLFESYFKWKAQKN